MLRGIYAPTDFKSLDRGPEVPCAEKLAIIANSPVLVSHEFKRGYIPDEFKVALPFVDGGWFHLGTDDETSYVYTDHINVGDRALYGNGIGTRLLAAGIQHALELDEGVSEFSTGWARLGLINTAVRVLGGENVCVDAYGQRFGYESDQPLDAVFDVFPPEPGKKCLVNGISARIDHERFSS